MINLIEKYVLETQFWVSIMMCCLCLFFGLLHQTVDYNRILIIFFCTLAAYNFINFHTWRKMFFRKIPGFLFLAGVVGSGYFLWKEKNLELTVILLFLSILVLLYNSSFLIIRFRNISLMKIFVISFVWTYFILKVGNDFVFSPEEFSAIFLFIIGITIPFDISDMERDSIQTLPKALGIRKSKYLSFLCLLTSGIVFYYAFNTKLDFVIPWATACLFSIILLLTMQNNKNTHFYTRFWIEACSSLPLVFYLLQKIRAVSF